MKPILITCWPIHLDYPLFRYNWGRFKQHFASMWIALSNHYQEVDYTNFIMTSLPDAYFVNVKHKGSDWRNDAMNETLDQIKTNEPICFMEQDFFVKDDEFFKKVFSNDYDSVFYKEGQRTHPAFAVVKREVIEKTDRDFSAYPQGDHFVKFFEQVGQNVIRVADIETMGVTRKEDFYHLNGLSQNYQNFKYDDPFYGKYAFLYYNFRCLGLPIANHSQFLRMEEAIEQKFGHPAKHDWMGRFFPE